MSHPTQLPYDELDPLLLSDPDVQAWFEKHLTDLRQEAYGPRLLFSILVGAFIVGLVAYVAGYLLSVATPDPSGTLVAPITQQQLANAIGSVREVVARTLHDLRSDGLVSASRARVSILDRDGLMRIGFDVT